MANQIAELCVTEFCLLILIWNLMIWRKYIFLQSCDVDLEQTIWIRGYDQPCTQAPPQKNAEEPGYEASYDVIKVSINWTI